LIKASGGINSREFAHELIEAGADRIGTSNGVAFVTGGVAGGGY
ncbi:MAG: 2-deoxyribose-5-phosphate aldolase, partial [bacterium]|nr:2-deoxyribose-5-phosphate aldolase [bacterium]